MNSPEQTPRPENPNAEKIKAARERQRARREAERILNQNRRRDPWSMAPDNPFLYLFSDYAFVLLIAGGGLLFVGALWLFENLRWPMYYFLSAADFVTGAAALPEAPFVVWTIWGAIFGACLGNWLIAPVFGQREARPLMLGLPLLLMVVSGLIFWAF